VTTETLTPDHTLFSKIMKNIRTCIGKEGGWRDEAVYGGLIAIRDIHQLESSLFDREVLRTLHDAMDKDKPFRVRKAAYDVMLVTRDQWPNSAESHQELDFVKQLHGLVVDIARPDYQCSFLIMMATLSEDEYWHQYLREAMEMWLPFSHEGPGHALHILTNVGGLLPRSEPPSPNESLEKRVEDEWAAVPGRSIQELSADQLRPLAEVTAKFQELTFDENDRKAVLAMVERVIPSLKERRDEGYPGPSEDVRGVVDGLLEKLRLPTSPLGGRRHGSTYW